MKPIQKKIPIEKVFKRVQSASSKKSLYLINFFKPKVIYKKKKENI